MCFARTAALHCGYEKQKVNASRDFWQQFLHHVQKCCEIHAKNMFCGCMSNAPKSVKPSKNCGFVRLGARGQCMFFGARNTWKTRFQSLQNLARTLQNHARSVPAREKKANEGQKSTQDEQEVASDVPKSLKKRPRAKNEPTWAQHGQFLTPFWKVLASPKHVKAAC